MNNTNLVNKANDTIWSFSVRPYLNNNQCIESKNIYKKCVEYGLVFSQKVKKEIQKKLNTFNISEGNTTLSIFAEDYATANGPARVLWAIEGIDLQEDMKNCNSMHECQIFMANSEVYTKLRDAAMAEQDGCSDMFGIVFTPPTNGNADIGVIFMEGGGFLSMCGHGCMAAAYALVESGIIKRAPSPQKIVFDTAAGLVTTYVDYKNGNVSLVNVPSYVSIPSLDFDFSYHNKKISLKASICFGGNYFALINAESIFQLFRNLEIKHIQSSERLSDNVEQLKKFGLLIRSAINQRIDDLNMAHLLPEGNKQVDLVEFYEPKTFKNNEYENTTEIHSQNLVIFGDDHHGQYDLSPCGTGTSAKLTLLRSMNAIDILQPFLYQSVTGSTFVGRILKESSLHVGGNKINTINPLITGHVEKVGYHRVDICAADEHKNEMIFLYDSPPQRCWNVNPHNKLPFDHKSHNELESSRQVAVLLS